RAGSGHQHSALDLARPRSAPQICVAANSDQRPTAAGGTISGEPSFNVGSTIMIVPDFNRSANVLAVRSPSDASTTGLGFLRSDSSNLSVSIVRPSAVIALISLAGNDRQPK